MSTLDYSPRSYNLPGKDPAELLFSTSVMLPVINRKWVPFILGVLEVLAQDEYWDDPATMVPQIDNLIAGLGKATFTTTFDHLDGLFRPTGCNNLIAAVGGASIAQGFLGFVGNSQYVVVAPGAAGQKGFSATMRDVDNNATPAGCLIATMATRKNDASIAGDCTVTVHFVDGIGDGTFSPETPEARINNKNLKDFTITRDTGGFVCVFSRLGPNLL